VLRLSALQQPIPPIAAVFLTHLHSDHTSGLPDLFNTSWVMGRKQPLQLYGPRGTQEMVNGLLKFYAEDIHVRRDLVEELPAKGAEIDVHIASEGTVYKDDNVTITAFVVEHRPVEPAFGYKFEAGGKSVVISGDTAKVTQRLSRYHTDAEQVGKIAAAAGVKKLVLTHLIPPEDSDKMRELAGKNFKGEIVIGKDLVRIMP
jgi:ribonuclease Z